MPDGPTRLLLDDHLLEAGFSVGHVEVRRITMPGGLPAGPHEHNGPVFGVVVARAVVFQVEDGDTAVLRPGDTFFEPAHTRISRFDAMSEGAEFLAWFPMPTGEPARLTTAP